MKKSLRRLPVGKEPRKLHALRFVEMKGPPEMNRVPLQLHLLAHPKSEETQRLARALMRRFMEPPASGGLRVPVFFTPDRGDDRPPSWNAEDGVNLDAGDHTIVVVLADARMTRQFDDETRATFQAWKSFFDEGLQRAPVGQSPHYVFAVAVGNGFALASEEDMLSVSEPPLRHATEDEEVFQKRVDKWIAEQVDDLALEITVRAIQLLEPKAKPEAEKQPPVHFFLSHAKKDLSEDKNDPIRHVERHMAELPIHYWFDAQDIPPSSKFAEEIEAGIRDCSIVVAFLTDEYASRPWCQREILDAKRLGVPILVVDALTSGEPRSYPYLGNLPTVHWSGAVPEIESRRIVSRAVRETLRFMHNRALLDGLKQDTDVVLATAPEALTLTWDADEASQEKLFLYPDPPLSKQELAVLNTLRPSAKFTTPLTRVAEKPFPGEPAAVAVSISASDDLARHGLAPEHQDTLSDEIHLYLLLAGLQIAYGGALSGDLADASNFTLRLFELVRSYSKLAENIGRGDLQPILNYAPWPLHLGYGDREYNLFGQVAKLIKGSQPPKSEVAEEEADLFPPGSGFRFQSDTPAQRLAWTRGLTAMRRQTTDGVHARIAIGGRLNQYAGLYPGIVEEAWMSLVRRQPLYLVGAFGGAADTVRAALVGDASLLTASLQSLADRQDVIDLAKQRGLAIVGADDDTDLADLDFTGKLISGEKIVADLLKVGRRGMATALNNGLSDEENRELFRSTQAPRISELILLGLSRLPIGQS